MKKYKMTASLFFSGVSALLLLIACAPNSKQETKIEIETQNNSALDIVNKAIDFAGSLQKWNDIASISYTKKSRLLLEGGQIESEITQRHSYKLHPRKSIKITWKTGEDIISIIHNDSLSNKYINDSLVASGEKVTSSVMSAIYVLGMPFKLLDKGTNLSYEGIELSDRLDTLNIIKASYAPEKYQNHSTNDLWWYYFRKSDGAFLKSKVYHHPTYALIENLARTQIDGLVMPEIRKSYRCDSLGNKQFLRAEFWYSDYDIHYLSDQ